MFGTLLSRKREEEGIRITKDYARVLFRRRDPNVLASIIPILSDEQFARVQYPPNFRTPDIAPF